MVGGAVVKGAFFVTAHRHLVENHGASALHAIARAMQKDNRHALLEPLPSHWYAEDVFLDAMKAVNVVHAQLDARVFCQFIEQCTVLGVHSFFRVLLRVTSPAYMLRQMPVMMRQFRRNDWTCEVDADDQRALITYGNCPYLTHRLYRIYGMAMVSQCVELCSSTKPAVELEEHGPDWMRIRVQYVPPGGEVARTT